MNCRTCQYELSQCLDGRLASGRRAVVMDHVATCTACDAFWGELQQAQALVLRLSRQRVGPDFRAQLFERIETGEGTPPAVFAEPVPLLQKARYIFTGAAAAAAVLVVATLMRKQPRVEPQTPELVARHLPPSTPPPEAFTAFQNTMPGLQRLTPDVVAVEAAKQFEEHHDRATHCLALLDQGKTDVAMALKVCDDAAELKNLGSMLLDLRDAKVLNFDDPQVDVDLRVVVQMLDDDRLRVRGIETVRTMVAPALRKSRSLGRLTASVTVAPALDPERQQQGLLRFTRSFPNAIDKFFFVVPDDAGFADLDPRELSRARFFTNECGPFLVVPWTQQRQFFGAQRFELHVQRVGQGGVRGAWIESRTEAAPPAGTTPARR